jgi:hypothetical protein
MKKNINFQGVTEFDLSINKVVVKVGGRHYVRDILHDPAGVFVSVNGRIYGLDKKYDWRTASKITRKF